MKIGIFCLILGLTNLALGCDLSTGWKGIKVFHSSRADVERAFGRPVTDANGEARYETEDAKIRVLFSGPPCGAPDTLLGGFSVKEGTVLQYEVHLKKPITVEELGIDSDIYNRVEDPEVLQFAHYYNKKAGISVSALRMSEVRNEIVRTIYFHRTEKDSTKFSCKR